MYIYIERKRKTLIDHSVIIERYVALLRNTRYVQNCKHFEDRKREREKERERERERERGAIKCDDKDQ
jgi:hypothetical protein